MTIHDLRSTFRLGDFVLLRGLNPVMLIGFGPDYFRVWYGDDEYGDPMIGNVRREAIYPAKPRHRIYAIAA